MTKETSKVVQADSTDEGLVRSMQAVLGISLRICSRVGAAEDTVHQLRGSDGGRDPSRMVR